MPARKKYTQDKLVKVATDAIAGLSKRDLMHKYPAVSERVIRLLMNNGVGAEEWRTALLGEIQSTAGEVLLELRKAVREGRYSPNSLPIALGILLDKGQVLEGRVQLRDLEINVLVNNHGSGSKADLLAELDGLRYPGTQRTSLLPGTGDTPESIQPVPQ